MLARPIIRECAPRPGVLAYAHPTESVDDAQAYSIIGAGGDFDIAYAHRHGVEVQTSSCIALDEVGIGAEYRRAWRVHTVEQARIAAYEGTRSRSVERTQHRCPASIVGRMRGLAAGRRATDEQHEGEQNRLHTFSMPPSALRWAAVHRAIPSPRYAEPVTISAERPQSRAHAGLQIRYDGFADDAVDYQHAWAIQRDLHERRAADEIDDTALFVEHPPVYTAGKRTNPLDRPADGTPVVDVDRGGSVTFHGPGQLVGYPIAKLPQHVYVVDYVRRVEEALIRAVGDLGITCGRVKGRSGVWVPADDRGDERKVAAIGVRVARKVTMHGFSLNCDVDLAWYDRFVPCGIHDAGVTSLSKELGRRVGVEEAAQLVEPHLRELLSWHDFDRSPDINAADSSTVTYGINRAVSRPGS